MRKTSFILLALTAFFAWSCHKDVEPGGSLSGYGSIELSLGSSNAIRLATKTNADDLLEGLRFNNVLVILVDNSDKVIGNVYKTYPYTNGGGSDIQDSEVATSVTEDVIHFEHLLPGDYHVYAYANINATEWQKTGEEITVQEKAVATGDFSGYLNRELLSLTSAGTDVPVNPSEAMLLTGHKTIPVGLSVVNDTLDLIRPLVRFKVTVRNHTRFPVNVDELRFSHFNPDKAYLLDHRDASGIPSVPAGVTYRSMPAFDTSAGDDNSVAANAEEVIYQRLMYENAYPGTYKIFAALTLNRTSESLGNLQLSLGDHPFGAIDYQTLSEMDDDEEVDVLVTNPQISPRSGRIFGYISANNYMAWESAGYENYNGYYSRAKAIYDQEVSHTYTQYTDAATQGYAAWDGISAHSPKETNGFNYSGAKSQYFHRLSKSNGLFTIEGLAINGSAKGTVSGTSISGFRIEAGSVVSGKNPSDVGGKLVRFKNDSDGKYIQANTNYKADVPKQQESNLMWQSGGTHQDRQFMLFGKYMSGGLLKRLLKENNKEVPLTYMARNEEINVVINVYYADQAGEITFTVDNSHWTGEGTTTSTHIFE